MENDRVLDSKRSFCAFVKNDIRDLSSDFFKHFRDKECNQEIYETNYDKSMDANMKKVAIKYHKNSDYLALTMESNISDSMLRMFLKTSLYIYVMRL